MEPHVMERRAPSEERAQAIRDLLGGDSKERRGAELLSELVRLSTEQVLQQLLEQEQGEFLGRKRYEREEGRKATGLRNGYERARVKTAEGVLEIQLPQVRGLPGPYESKIWSRLGNKTEVLEHMVTEMWVRGLSVRDVEEAMLAATGAFVLSDTAVSYVTEQLYSQYEAFRTRDLSSFDVAYLFIDAVYEPLRRHGSKLAILCAWGITTDGRRMLLDLTTGNGESEMLCLEFLRGMVTRGLQPPLTVTTDGALGLISAVETAWPHSKRIRCWFHKMQNLQDKVPPDAWPSFKAQVIDVRDAATKEEAQRRFNELVKSKERELPEACRCLKDDLDASLNHLIVPLRHRVMVRTTNYVERSFVEERRRTKVIPNIWDEKSAIKLVFATLIRVSERWSRMRFSAIEQRQILNLREQLGLQNKEETINQKSSHRRSAGRVAS
jgi:transposase-like protein